MSDVIVPESGAGPTELAVPTVQTSPQVPAPATSSQVPSEDALVDKVFGRLMPELDKRFQSIKDKRLSVLDNGGVEAIDRLKDYIKAHNGNVDAAVKDMKVDDLLAGRTGTPVQAVVGGTTPAVDNTNARRERTRDVLNEAEIAFDDPQYLALVKAGATDDADWDRKLNRFAIQRLKQSRVPGAATAIPDGGGTAPVAGGAQATLDRKYARLRELQVAPPTASVDREMSALSDEIIKLGGHA